MLDVCIIMPVIIFITRYFGIGGESKHRTVYCGLCVLEIKNWGSEVDREWWVRQVDKIIR